MGAKRRYKQYPKEFKKEAVVLVQVQSYSVPEASNR